MVFRLLQQTHHLLMHTIVFVCDMGWLCLRRNGGRVYVAEKVGVEVLLGPEMRARFCWLPALVGSSVCPNAEDGIYEGCGGAENCAGYGGGSPLVRFRGKQVVGYRDETGEGGNEGRSVWESALRCVFVGGERYRKTPSAWKRSLRQAKQRSAVNE